MSISHFDTYPANCQKIESRNLKETTFVLMTSMRFLIYMQNLRPGLFFEQKSRGRKLQRRPLNRQAGYATEQQRTQNESYHKTTFSTDFGTHAMVLVMFLS